MAEPQKAAAPAATKPAVPKVATAAAKPAAVPAVAKPAVPGAASAAAPASATAKAAAPATAAKPAAAPVAKKAPAAATAAAPAAAAPAGAAPAEGEQDLEAMKKKFKPKKKVALPTDMLSDAKSYDDKLILMKFLTEKEKGRVVLMVKNMLRGALDAGKKK